MKIALFGPLAALILTLSAACGGELSNEEVPLSKEDVLNKLAPSLVTLQFRRIDVGSGFLVNPNPPMDRDGRREDSGRG